MVGNAFWEAVTIYGQHARRDAAPRRCGELVGRLRVERGLSQERLGEFTGMHRNYIGAVERVERTPSIVAADRIAGALGLSLAGLFAELERDSDAPG